MYYSTICRMALVFWSRSFIYGHAGFLSSSVGAPAQEDMTLTGCYRARKEIKQGAQQP